MTQSKCRSFVSMSVVIDGNTHFFSFEERKKIIDACDEIGIRIPRFCYHPQLSIPANCRMCVVEIEGLNCLVPSCHTDLADGMVIQTSSEKVKKAREAVLELLLVNHPVDCPICDQSGECPLQDQYYEHDRRPSRIGPPDRKVKKKKKVRVGPRVILDQERCVLCTRCTRFLDEVAGSPELGMFWRNDHAHISNVPGRPLNSNYSLNTVAICPVGALTSSDFRFRKRVWDLKSSPGICEGCSRGCNSWVDWDRSRVYRFRARTNKNVNKDWMCDQGFLSYKHHNDSRILSVLKGRGAEPGRKRHEDIADTISSILGKKRDEGSALAFLISPGISTEDAMAAAWFVSEVMKADCIYTGGRAMMESDPVLLRADRNPNNMGLMLAAKARGLEIHPFGSLFDAIIRGEITAVYGIGADVPTPDPAGEAFSSLEFFALQATNINSLTRVADIVLPAAVPSEYDGTYVNFMGRIQKFHGAYEPRGSARPHWKWISDIAGRMGKEAGFDSSGQVYNMLSTAIFGLEGIRWDDIGMEGIKINGIGAKEDQTGGISTGPKRGVSKWPR